MGFDFILFALCGLGICSLLILCGYTVGYTRGPVRYTNKTPEGFRLVALDVWREFDAWSKILKPRGQPRAYQHLMDEFKDLQHAAEDARSSAVKHWDTACQWKQVADNLTGELTDLRSDNDSLRQRLALLEEDETKQFQIRAVPKPSSEINAFTWDAEEPA